MPVIGGDSSETPGAHVVVNAHYGALDALLVDDTLAGAVDAGATTPASAPLTVQRVLSELLMIQAERPFDQRAIVIAPDRRWAPSASYAAALLAGSGRVPWVAPVTLPEVVAGPVYDKVQRAPVAYPSDERALELRKSYLRGVLRSQGQVDAFSQILPIGDAQARAFDEALLRLLSSAWRGQPLAADAARLGFDDGLDQTLRKVHITTPNGSLVTLTSHSGIVPITVENSLDTPIRIAVRVFDVGQRLDIGRRSRAVRTIPPHRQFPVDVHAKARTSGIFPLTVALYTPNGRRYDPNDPTRSSVQLYVRSTAYGIEALIITGVATAALFIGAGVRLGRRARAARRASRAQA
jgi:Family of unknown function (DUF6049)